MKVFKSSAPGSRLLGLHHLVVVGLWTSYLTSVPSFFTCQMEMILCYVESEIPLNIR